MVRFVTETKKKKQNYNISRADPFFHRNFDLDKIRFIHRSLDQRMLSKLDIDIKHLRLVKHTLNVYSITEEF